MKRLAIVGLLFTICLTLVTSSSAQTPSVINYQGRLISGTNLFSGTVGISLRIYTNDVGGTMIYEDSNDVAVVDGLYSTFIGDNTTAGNLTTALAAPEAKYIEVAINGSALSPREPLASVAYARTAVLKSGDTMTGALTINSGGSSKLLIDSAGSSIGVGNSANGDIWGTAVGYQANGNSNGVAVGSGAIGDHSGAVMGYQANGWDHGAAVGREANGSSSGAAVGSQANGWDHGAAVGFGATGIYYGAAMGFAANGYSVGAAVGWLANGYNVGAAVGYSANGIDSGAAIGGHANGYTFGAAVGPYSSGFDYGAALGYSADGEVTGVAVGREANGRAECIAVGAFANSGPAAHSIALGYSATVPGGVQNSAAIGYNVANDVSDSTRVRGTLYLDGGTGVVYRSTFGSGTWSTKAFTIDHPLDPQNKVLRHYCLEGPQVWNVYAGNAQLLNGIAVVQLPEYYGAENKVGSEVYDLTAVGGKASLWIERETDKKSFVIGGDADVKVSWTIKVLRNDPAALADLKQRPVEQLKSELAPGQAAAENAGVNTDSSTR